MGVYHERGARGVMEVKSYGAKILVVDDEPHIRGALRDYLELQGYPTVAAANGPEALAELKRDEFFLVITDITMPGMDGLSLLHEIKLASPDVDVVVITGSQNIDCAILAMREGAFDYFPKPFLFDDIALTVQRACEKKRLQLAATELEVVKEKARVERRAMMEATFGLAQAVEEKDPYTKGHSERVANLSVELARRLGYTHEKLDRVRIAGLLHDVGKIAIPEEILSKKGPLTKSEYLLIKKHPEIGARILTPMSFLQDIIPAILHHHESFDGTGYPEGLEGEEIPREAMIIKVCDCFDAVTSNRPYRRPMTTIEALRLIERESGRSMEPSITAEFLTMMNERHAELAPPPPAPDPADPESTEAATIESEAHAG